MVVSIALLLQGFETGYLTGLVGWRRRQRQQIHERLIWGRRQPTKLALLDKKLERLVYTPTQWQAWLSTRLVRLIRWAVQTRAFELVLLRLVQQRGRRRGIHSEVKLCL